MNASAGRTDRLSALRDAQETDEQVENRLTERFEILDMLTHACTSGKARSLIVSGPAGLGKSYTVEHHLSKWDPNGVNHTIVKGFVRATGLVKLLYQHREPGQVLVFDDADSVFFDDVSLNLLKATCDTTEQRRVSWLSEGNLVDEESGERMPRSFDFDGSIIFISNMDFDAMIDANHKLSPHLSALISRSHYVDLSMRTRRDYLVRIRQVIVEGLLDHLTIDQRVDVMNFIEVHSDRLRELSLRVALKVGALRAASEDWARIALVTCCRM